MPTGGTVVSGSATITQQSGSQITIRQTTDRGAINWQSFSIGNGGSVTFQQNSASSATLNRVTGGTSSVIAGQLSANGQVFLVNPNGIQITSTGTVRTGSFVASTLDIRNEDFIAGRHIFNGNGSSATVTNSGSIEVTRGGTVALIGGRVLNDGTIVADGGRVGLASGERVVVDMQGDGFLQVSIPTADADRATALVTHAGRIRANGGRVELRAATTADVARNAINVPGTIEARSVARTSGGVVFGDAPMPSDAVVERGRVTINGGAGGAVKVTGVITANGGTTRQGGTVAIAGTSVGLAGAIDVSGRTGGSVNVSAAGALGLTGTVSARGLDGAGGTVQYAAVFLTASSASVTDVSSTTFGGTISADGGASLNVAGSWLANGGTNGGRIDLTADDVRVSSALLSAIGGERGGLVGIGGAFQGGAQRDNSPELEATFVTRWADAPDLRSASETRVYGTATIDVSGGTNGGTAIVWANGSTWMAGTVNAGGALSAGSIEISGKGNLAYLDLAKITLGAGGQLLLDPKNIVIATGGASPVDANDQFSDNPAGTSTISPTLLTAVLNAGTNVTLQASNDITVNNGWTANGAGANAGSITLEAGRNVTIASGVTITTDNGAFTIIANTNNASRATDQRDAGAATIDLRGSTINAGTGNVTITMSSGSTGGDIRLGAITSTSDAGTNNINVVYSAAAAGSVELNGNLTAGDNVILPDRNLIIGADSVLTSGSGGGTATVTWAGEATGRSIVGAAGGETIRFVEGSTTTRIGVMDTSDAARLAMGAASASRQYGDANPVVGGVTLISGSLRPGDALASIVSDGGTTTSWTGGTPDASTDVGTLSYTVTPTGTPNIVPGRTGYFLNTAAVSGQLTITPRPITVTADAQTKEYGDADPALTYQITSGNLVGGDTLNGSLLRSAGENVGNYAILGVALTNANYAITYVGANLSITRRPITVRADAKTKVYGNADPTLTYQIIAGNLVRGTTLSGTLLRAAGENVGSYTIARGTLANANYAITYIGANLSVTPRPITVTADDKSKLQGEPDPVLTWRLTSGTTVFGNLSTGVLTRAPGDVPGNYAISKGSFTFGPNYALTFVNGLFTITSTQSEPLPAIAGGTTSNGGNSVLTGMFAPSAGRSTTVGDVDDNGRSGAASQSTLRNCVINGQGTLICPPVTP